MTAPVAEAEPAVPALTRLLAGVMTLASLAWAGDLYRRAGLVFYPEQFYAAMLGIGLCLVFLHLPARRRSRRGAVPWYDAVAAALGALAGGYVAAFYPDLINRLVEAPADALIVAVLLFVLCVDGLRRTAGNTLVVIVLALVAYALLGHLVPGQFQTREISLRSLLVYVTLDTGGLFGFGLAVATTIVFAFVLFGRLLASSGGADVFNEIALALMGRYRGGSAKIAITASSLFGTISGLAASNILATGVVTIPLMRQAGYPSHIAAAIEAVASTGGQIMPPVMGAVAFLMADILAIPYSSVVLAALIPAVLYYVALFILADLEAAKLGIAPVDPAILPRAGVVLRQGWPFAIPFAVLIYALFGLNLEAETAALYACGAVVTVGVVVGYRGRRMPLVEVVEALIATGLGVLDVLMIIAAAGFILGVLNVSGIGFLLTVSLVQLGQGNLPLLLVLAAAMCIVLGMGMPTIGVYILLAVLFAPSLVELGVPPLAAHLFIFYFGMMSLVTPPVAIAAFFAANLAGAPPMRTGFAATRLGWTAYIVPFLFVFSPSLLLQGDPIHVVIAVVTAVGGVWLVSAAITGYFVRPLGWLPRLGAAIAGLLLMLPPGIAVWWAWANLVGLALALLVMGREVAAVRRRDVEPLPYLKESAPPDPR